MKQEFQLEVSAMILTKQDVFKKTKQELMYLMGLCYNDINSNIWMYRLKSSNRLLSYRYLYIVFVDNKVKHLHFTRYKTCRFLKATAEILN